MRLPELRKDVQRRDFLRWLAASPLLAGAGGLASLEPIIAQEHAVTRCAVTNEKDVDKERTMGRKFTVPYGLYRVHGFINPHLAAQTGFDENGEDLNLFWKALEQMFEHDRSASRGEMSPRRLIVFRHDSRLGNAPAHRLFERVTIARGTRDGESDSNGDAPRQFSDYMVTVDETDLPEGITIETPF